MMSQICMMTSQGMFCTSIDAILSARWLIMIRENTATLRDIGLGRGRVSLASGRDSDIRPAEFPGDDTENTFVFTVPPRDATDPQQSDDAAETPSGEIGNNYSDQEVEVEGEDPEASDNPMEGEADTSIQETTLLDIDTSVADTHKVTRKKRIKISKHGIQYPSLPPGVVKKLATTYARTSGNSKAKISKDTLDAIIQASDWFFEQISDDLGAYAEHAGRKTIEESDVLTLMKRYVLPHPRRLAISNSTYLQTTPDKHYDDAFFISSEVSSSRASTRIANGSSFKNQKGTSARERRRGGRGRGRRRMIE